jgi:hypothetical protein
MISADSKLTSDPGSLSVKKLFVLYFKEGYIGVAPTVLGLAEELTSAGHDVEIRAVRTDFASPGDLPPSCRVIRMSRLRSHLFLVGTKLRTLSWVLEIFWYALQNLCTDLAATRSQRERPRINIGVDAPGAISAWLDSLIWRRKYLYLSLELPSSHSYQYFAKSIHWLERKAIKDAAAIIIQDADRLESLSRFHEAIPSRRFFLPNSPHCSGSNTDLSPAENYLRRQLNISSRRFPHIALHAGMIEDVVYSQELVRAFAGLDSGFALVLHERRKRRASHPYLQALRRLNSRNLFLSLDPVPFDQLYKVFASATVGLAFYRPIDDNHAKMGLASGKLAFYLRHGIPVLTNSLPSFAALNEKYGFAVLINDVASSEELGNGLETIMAKYALYSRNARDCFRQEFNFSAKCTLIRSFLESML